jgi:hypothetical protein
VTTDLRAVVVRYLTDEVKVRSVTEYGKLFVMSVLL